MISEPSTARKFYEPAARVVRRPEWIEICAGQLWYRPSFTVTKNNDAPVTANLLRRFVAMEHASDEAIVAFARDHAALGICAAHGLPLNHRHGFASMLDLMEYLVMPPADCEEDNPRETSDRGTYYYENINDWRIWAQRFRILIEQIDAARWTPSTEKRRIQKLHIAFMLGWTRDTTLPTYEKVSWHRATKRLPDLLRVVNAWLDYAGVRAQLTVSREGKALPDLGGNPAFLFPALALQMLFYIVGGGLPEIAHCASCGEPLTNRLRRPKTGQNAWCKKPECGRVRKNLPPLRPRTAHEPKTRTGRRINRKAQ